MEGKKRVRMGQFVKVANTKPKGKALDHYYAIKLEAENGRNEHWYMFSGKEINAMPVADVPGLMAQAKLGRMYWRHRYGNGWKSFAYVLPPAPEGEGQVADDTPVCLVFSDTILKRTRKRAGTNKEDTPRMSWLQDLLD